MHELECKLKLSDPAGLIARLAGLGATDHGTVFEHNEIFDRSGELSERRELLRIRVLDGNDWGLLTHKRPAPEGDFKCRVETETRVESADAARTIFESLGYRREWVYEKRRRSWSLGACEIVLDELPELGYFMEIEAPDEATIDGMLRTLGLARQADMKLNYRQIWRDHCARTGRNCSDWRF